MNNIRQEVLDFALKMEARLQEKDAQHPNGWAEDTINGLMDNLGLKLYHMFEASELEKDSKEAIHKLAVDVANFAMMIADKTK